MTSKKIQVRSERHFTNRKKLPLKNVLDSNNNYKKPFSFKINAIFSHLVAFLGKIGGKVFKNLEKLREKRAPRGNFLYIIPKNAKVPPKKRQKTLKNAKNANFPKSAKR